MHLCLTLIFKVYLIISMIFEAFVPSFLLIQWYFWLSITVFILPMIFLPIQTRCHPPRWWVGESLRKAVQSSQSSATCSHSTLSLPPHPLHIPSPSVVVIPLQFPLDSKPVPVVWCLLLALSVCVRPLHRTKFPLVQKVPVDAHLYKSHSRCAYHFFSITINQNVTCPTQPHVLTHPKLDFTHRNDRSLDEAVCVSSLSAASSNEWMWLLWTGASEQQQLQPDVDGFPPEALHSEGAAGVPEGEPLPQVRYPSLLWWRDKFFLRVTVGLCIYTLTALQVDSRWNNDKIGRMSILLHQFAEMWCLLTVEMFAGRMRSHARIDCTKTSPVCSRSRWVVPNLALNASFKMVVGVRQIHKCICLHWINSTNHDVSNLNRILVCSFPKCRI